MPSTDRKLELTAKASMAQPVSQTAVCSNGLSVFFSQHSQLVTYVVLMVHVFKGGMEYW